MQNESCPLQKNVLITGRPGIGKTTVIKSVIGNLRSDAGGFYTEEIREKGTRIGFRLKTLDGKEGILASVEIKSDHRVGKYGVNLQVLEQIGVGSVNSAIRSGKVVIIDEIGKMEMFSLAFREAVLAAILNPQPMVATIQERGNPFCDFLKKRGDVSIITLREGNRNEVAGEVLKIIERYTAPNASC